MNSLEMYVGSLMSYIEMEYFNIPSDVTPEMEEYFVSCYEETMCFPNAAGGFYETFLRRNEVL